MKKIIVIAVLVSVMWNVSAQAGAGRIAAFPFTGNAVEDTDTGEFYVGLFTSQFVSLGYTLVTRTAAISTAMEEINYQSTGMTGEVVDLGKQLSADYVLVGSVGQIGSRYSLRVEVVGVETSEIAASDTRVLTSLDEIFNTSFISQIVSVLHQQISRASGETVSTTSYATMAGTTAINDLKLDYEKAAKSKKIARGWWIGGLAVAGAGSVIISLALTPDYIPVPLVIGGSVAIAGGIADIVYSGKMKKIEEELKSSYGVQISFMPSVYPTYSLITQEVNWNAGMAVKVSL